MIPVAERPTFAFGESKPGHDIVVTPEMAEGVQLYVARHPALPHVFAQGLDPNDAMTNLDEVREAFLADMMNDKVAVPPMSLHPQVEIIETLTAAPQEQSSRSSWRVIKGDVRIVPL